MKPKEKLIEEISKYIKGKLDSNLFDGGPFTVDCGKDINSQESLAKGFFNCNITIPFEVLSRNGFILTDSDGRVINGPE